MAHNREFVPWYRREDYRGILKENHKRKLDAIRYQDKHPATEFYTLPEDVQRYIEELELNIYQTKTRLHNLETIVGGGIGGYLLYAAWTGERAYSLFYGILGVGLIVWTVIRSIQQHQKLDADHWASVSDPDWPSISQEGIRRNWEYGLIGELIRDD